MASKKLTELQKSSSPSGKRIPIEGSGQVMEYTTPEDILDTPHVLPPDSIPALTEDKIPQLPASKIDGIDTAIQGGINEVNAGLVTQVNNLDNNKGALWNKDKVTAPTDFDATDGGGKFLSMDNKWETPSVPVLSDIAIAGEDLGQAGELTPVFFGTGGETITDGQSATVGETSTETTFTLPTSSVSPYVREILITKTEVGNPDDVYVEDGANTNERWLLPVDFTTYTKDGWTLGANSEYSDTPARKARNGDTSDSWGSFWSTDFNNLTVSESAPAIFTIQAPNKKIFEKVKVRWRKNNSTDNRAVDTEIFGVNNGVRTSLGARTGQNEPASAVEREYILSNNSEGFTSLEIKITRASSSDQIIINDIDIYGFDYGKQVSIPNGQSVLKIDNTVTDLTFTTAGASPSNYSTITIDEVRYGYESDKIYRSGKPIQETIPNRYSISDNETTLTHGIPNTSGSWKTIYTFDIEQIEGYGKSLIKRAGFSIYAGSRRPLQYAFFSGDTQITLTKSLDGQNNSSKTIIEEINKVGDTPITLKIKKSNGGANGGSSDMRRFTNLRVEADAVYGGVSNGRGYCDGVYSNGIIVTEGPISAIGLPKGPIRVDDEGFTQSNTGLCIGTVVGDKLRVGRVPNSDFAEDNTHKTGNIVLGNAIGFIEHVLPDGSIVKIPYYGV